MRIFLAAPISGFNDEQQYNEFRMSALALIETLSKRYEVISELITISGTGDYDSPSDSAKKDFLSIKESDIFLMIHPQKIQTSSLIELGYAYAYEKEIVIVSNTADLPFLSLGLNAHIINGKIQSQSVREEIKKIIDIIAG